MKHISRLIRLLLALAFCLVSNLGIGSPSAMADNIGSAMSRPPIPASAQRAAVRNVPDQSSQLVQADPFDADPNLTGTEETYTAIGFDPETSADGKRDLTSARVLKPVFNQYDQYNGSKPKVFGYYTDWSQYDGRVEPVGSQYGCSSATYNGLKDCAGRGFDLAEVDPLAYDEIILGFLGICGDPVEGVPGMGDTLSKACRDMGKDEDAATFIDLWGDIAAVTNNNVDGDPPTYDYPYHEYMNQPSIKAGVSKGVLAGLYNLQQDAAAQGHELELAFSIGGWSLSDPFSELVKVGSRRATFVDSVVDIFNDFPMFSTVDIDWEYPGGGGLNPSVGDQINDGPKYASLIGDLRQALDSNFGVGTKKINIAAAAVPDKMQYSNIPGLFAAGLDGINVMTYDFFGGSWSEALMHHNNLRAYDVGADVGDEYINSIEKAIEYLDGEGVDMSKVYIGYAGYSRNALDANITSESPLQGTLTKPAGYDAIGSFDPLASEYNDVLYNHFDPENQSGRNGYELFTDAEANADYLYSDTSGVFMSIDTPRSVYAKAKYAADHNLGGIFTWTADQDKGLLANAAREGAGYNPNSEAINMSGFYFCGDNVDSGTCDDLTYSDEAPTAPVANAGLDQTVTGPTTVTLDGENSSDPNGDTLTFNWAQSSGPSVTLMNPTTATPSFEVQEPAGPSDTYVFSLSVSDGTETDDDSVTVTVEGEGGCDYDYVYPDGRGTYEDNLDTGTGIGTIVLQPKDNNLYECSSVDGSLNIDSWCNSSDENYYEPGFGSADEQAWQPYGSCPAGRSSSFSKSLVESSTGTTPDKIVINVERPVTIKINAVK